MPNINESIFYYKDFRKDGNWLYAQVRTGSNGPVVATFRDIKGVQPETLYVSPGDVTGGQGFNLSIYCKSYGYSASLSIMWIQEGVSKKMAEKSEVVLPSENIAEIMSKNLSIE